MMKSYWWKILGVLIILYAIIAGMTVPLSPGVIKVTPDFGGEGNEVEVIVEGYNTFYTKSENVRGWLKSSDEFILQATESKVIDDTHVQLIFQLPNNTPTNNNNLRFSVIIDSDNDGYGVLPNKFGITKNGIVNQEIQTAWKNEKITDLSPRGTTFPFRGILFETIRNTYYHVPLWFGMLFLFLIAAIYSVMNLITKKSDYDFRASSLTSIGLLYGMLGLITGMIWAKHTWGTYWTWEEVKMNMTAIALLLYCAYFVLRASFDDFEKRARISSVYNIFIFAALIPLIYVVPRLYESLHPGSGGNPAMGGEDLDNTMRMVFYPAIIGFFLIGLWMSSLVYRYKVIEDKVMEND